MGLHFHFNNSKVIMGRVSVVKACFFASMIGILSAQEDFTCPMEGYYCSPPVSAPTVELTATVMDKAAQDECYTECFNKKGDPDAPCLAFTLKQIGGRPPTCYLLDTDCDPDTDDVCIEQGKCISGPADCASPPTTTCPPIAPFEVDAANWVCTDEMGDLISISPDPVPTGTTCTQSCPAWKSDADPAAPVMVESTCQSDGTWSAPANIDGSAVTYPDPATLQDPSVSPVLACGCTNLELQWPYEDPAGVYYNPSDEEGTDFICDKPLLDPTGSGEWAIEPDNTCKLFCDGHYVATAQCIDGFWTGNPEWGFWCYTEPSASPPVLF